MRTAKYLIVWVLLMPVTVIADAFIWVNEDNHTEMSGRPPDWYRNTTWKGKAPRTQLYRNGRLIDDTALHVEQNDAEELRAIALDREMDSDAAAARMRERLRQVQGRRVPEDPQVKAQKEADIKAVELVEKKEAAKNKADAIVSGKYRP